MVISLKRIVYYIDEATSNVDTYISIKDLCRYFSNEDCDHITMSKRMWSQITRYRNLFVVNKIGGRSFWRLSANGKGYLNKFKNFYDPVTDKLLFQTEKIEVF